MTDRAKMVATDIFDAFTTRRDMLIRSGKIGLAAGLPLALAACLEVPDNAFRELAGGAKEIQIVDGRNCWMNRCFTYDADRQELSVTGHEPIPVPPGVDLSDGYVSEAEFDALLRAARTAARVKSDGNDGGDTGSTSGGPGGE
jgi:hypothetical protein